MISWSDILDALAKETLLLEFISFTFWKFEIPYVFVACIIFLLLLYCIYVALIVQIEFL